MEEPAWAVPCDLPRDKAQELTDRLYTLLAAAFCVACLADIAFSGQDAGLMLVAVLLLTGTALRTLAILPAIAFVWLQAARGHPVQPLPTEPDTPGIPTKLASKAGQAATHARVDLIPSWSGQEAATPLVLITPQPELKTASEADGDAASTAGPRTPPAAAIEAANKDTDAATEPQTPRLTAQPCLRIDTSGASDASWASDDTCWPSPDLCPPVLDVLPPLPLPALQPPQQLAPRATAPQPSGNKPGLSIKAAGARVQAIMQRLEAAAAAAVPSAGPRDARAAAQWRCSVRSLARAYEASITTEHWRPLQYERA